jgi:hypothetical protein
VKVQSKMVKRVGRKPVLTSFPVLISCPQNFALRYLFGGKVWYGDFEPHFFKERWGFLLKRNHGKKKG